jgi:hypothetical protein
MSQSARWAEAAASHNTVFFSASSGYCWWRHCRLFTTMPSLLRPLRTSPAYMRLSFTFGLRSHDSPGVEVEEAGQRPSSGEGGGGERSPREEVSCAAGGGLAREASSVRCEPGVVVQVLHDSPSRSCAGADSGRAAEDLEGRQEGEAGKYDQETAMARGGANYHATICALFPPPQRAGNEPNSTSPDCK